MLLRGRLSMASWRMAWPNRLAAIGGAEQRALVHHLSGPALRRLVVLMVLIAAAVLGRRPSMSTLTGGLGLIGLAVLLRFPRFRLPLLIITAAFVPFRIGTGTGSTINAAMLCLAALSTLWIAESVLVRRRLVVPSIANRPWIAIIGVAFISVLAGSADWNPVVSVRSSFIMAQLGQLAVYALSAAAFWLVGSTAAGRRELRLLSFLLVGLGGYWLTTRLVPGTGRVGSYLTFDAAMFRVWVVALAGGFALYWPQLGWLMRMGLGAIAVSLVTYPWLTAADWAGGWVPTFAVLGVLAVPWGWRHMRAGTIVMTTVGLPAAVLLVLHKAAPETWSVETRAIAWHGLVELLRGRWLLGLGLASYWHYWRGILGTMSYRDPSDGYFHFTFDPKVNMHNNYLDVLGQMGIVGLTVMLWLMATLATMAWRLGRSEPPGFGQAYAVASFAALVGMAVAGMLGDWLFPFVYNIGLNGFRESFLGWFFLGGLVVLERTKASAAPAADHDARATVRS